MVNRTRIHPLHWQNPRCIAVGPVNKPTRLTAVLPEEPPNLGTIADDLMVQAARIRQIANHQTAGDKDQADAIRAAQDQAARARRDADDARVLYVLLKEAATDFLNGNKSANALAFDVVDALKLRSSK